MMRSFSQDDFHLQPVLPLSSPTIFPVTALLNALFSSFHFCKQSWAPGAVAISATGQASPDPESPRRWMGRSTSKQSVSWCLFPSPICSMYGIFAYIYPTNGPNVGKYTIHGPSGSFSNPKCVRLMCFDRWVRDSFRVTTDVGDEPQWFFLYRPNGDVWY